MSPYGGLRLRFRELWNDSSNTSDIYVSLQADSPYTGEWIVRGEIELNGEILARSGSTVRSKEQNKWTDCAVWQISGIGHNGDGSGYVSLKVSRPGSGYSNFTLAGSVAAAYLSLLPTQGENLPLHKNESGIRIFIGGAEYSCLICNGNSYDTYAVKIGDGSKFE